MKLSLSTVALVCFSTARVGADNIFARNTLDKEKNLREKVGLKRTSKLKLQTVRRRDKSFKIGEEDVQFNDLVPVSNLFAPGAKVMIDGVEQEPQVFLYESTTDKEVKVLLDKKKTLIKASKRKANGDLTDIIHVDKDEFLEVDPSDVDDSQFEGYDSDGVKAPGSRSLRGVPSPDGYRRNLLQVSTPSPHCDVIAKGTVYIAADSDFVADANMECDFCALENGNKAAAAIQEIFAAVKEVFLRDSCLDLTLKGYDIRTDPNNDPYRDARLASGEVCTNDDDSFLNVFNSWLNVPGNDPSNKDRTVFHLFYGNPNAAGYRKVGCAYSNGQCNPFYGTGISEMSWKGTYSSSLTLKRNLFAHELGHNFNANHESGIMGASIGSSEHFTPHSVGQIQGCINGGCKNTCLEFVSNAATNDVPTEAPTNSPTSSPTAKPTDIPTSSPTHRPTSKPTSGPTSQPTKSPTRSPTGNPTNKPTMIPTFSHTNVNGESCVAMPASCSNHVRDTPNCCSSTTMPCARRRKQLMGQRLNTKVCTGVWT